MLKTDFPCISVVFKKAEKRMREFYTRLSQTFFGSPKRLFDGMIITLALWSTSGLLMMLFIDMYSALSGHSLPAFMPLCTALTYLLIGLLGITYSLQRFFEEKHSGTPLAISLTSLGGGLLFVILCLTVLATR